MNYAIRRDDREPNKYSRVCSCHFRDRDKRNLQTISNRNKDKLFDLLPGAEPKPPLVGNREQCFKSFSCYRRLLCMTGNYFN